MLVSINAKKHIWQNSISIHKTLRNADIEESFYNIKSLIKSIHKNPTANIKLKGERLNAFPLR